MSVEVREKLVFECLAATRLSKKSRTMKISRDRIQ